MNDEYLKSAKGEPPEPPPPPPPPDVPPERVDRGEPLGSAPVSTGASLLREMTAAPSETTETPSVGPRWLAWVLPAVFVLALVAAFAWRLLVLSQTSAESQNRIAEIGSQLDSLRQETEGHAKTEAEQLARLQGKVEEQQRLQEAHGISIEKLALLASQDSEDLIFAEVAYLLGIAQQRLSFERDIPTAIRAMEAADQRLLNLIRPDLETVRAVLMEDLNDLRAVPVVDTTGPALYLADVLKRIDSLPFQGGLTRASDENAGKPAEAVKTPRPSVQSFDEAAERMWNDLLGLVSIKKLGAEEARIFDPNFRKLIEQQLELEISNARLELSRRNGAAFKATLGALAGLFGRYYDGTDPAVASIQKRLAEMQALELSPAIPDISKSIKGLREYVVARRKLGTPEAPAQDDGAEGPGATRPAPDEDGSSDAPNADPETPDPGTAPPEGTGENQINLEATPGTVTAPGDTPAAPPSPAPTDEPAEDARETPGAAP